MRRATALVLPLVVLVLPVFDRAPLVLAVLVLAVMDLMLAVVDPSPVLCQVSAFSAAI